jgi:hypothetical protein
VCWKIPATNGPKPLGSAELQAEGIGRQQTEIAGMTVSGMAKIAGRVEDGDSQFFPSNIP